MTCVVGVCDVIDNGVTSMQWSVVLLCESSNTGRTPVVAFLLDSGNRKDHYFVTGHGLLGLVSDFCSFCVCVCVAVNAVLCRM